MSDHWKTIIQSRYVEESIDAEKVRGYVPLLITQTECDEILKLKP